MLESLIARCLYCCMWDPLPAITSKLVPCMAARATALVLLLQEERVYYDI